MIGHVGPRELRLESVARFANGPVETETGLHWNIDALYASVREGLGVALRRQPGIRSIGIDSWAVDYALLRDGVALGAPFHYRDDRNLRAVDDVHGRVSAADLYRANGLQHLPFNTLFQFAADEASGDLARADSFLLIPDLLGYWLTGTAVAERTNASTTGLLGVDSHEWDFDLIERLGLPRSFFPPLIDAGSILGALSPAVARELGAAADVVVTAVGSHDTASAVAAIPARTADFAYISCGTWGLVGVELEHPVLSEASRAANFTNEGGVDDRVRYLHNVMGLWLLSESVRDWEAEDAAAARIDLPELLAAASAVSREVSIFDANDPVFLAPGNMTGRIATWFTDRGLRVPEGRAEFVRSIIESLASAFADAVHTAAELSGKTVSVIHVVGGGSQNELLCQLTADRSGLPVLAGPVEATAMGNVLLQARAQGIVVGGLEQLRAIVAAAFEPVPYSPRVGADQRGNR